MDWNADIPAPVPDEQILQGSENDRVVPSREVRLSLAKTRPNRPKRGALYGANRRRLNWRSMDVIEAKVQANRPLPRTGSEHG